VSDQIGSPTAAHSIARAIWALAERPALNGIFHWTDAGVASWYDFAVAIAEEAAAAGLLEQTAEVTPITTDEFPTPARRPAFSVLDSRATAAAIGFSPPHWRASLRLVINEIAPAA
jgi:dTDP-4-dehydrorhamnose reductase